MNLPREQIIFQLQRLQEVKEMCHKFWDNYYHSHVPTGSQHNTGLVLSLNLNDIFLCPFLSFVNQAEADDNFINDLQDSIRYKEEVLQDFEQAVSKIINRDKELETVLSSTPTRTKAIPVFKTGIAEEFFNLVKDYFSVSDQPRLIELLNFTNSSGEPLVFNGAGNQLADAFKQLFDANLIVGCNKSELENWILLNFQYRDKGMQKSYTEKYLQDMISSNTKSCQSPLFDVRKIDGQFYLSPLTRNNKNSKR